MKGAKAEPAPTGAQRGYQPPRTEEERLLIKRAEELCRRAVERGIPLYTGFLSDREQVLARAGANRAGCECIRFWGGYEGAERKMLCIEPPDAWQEEPSAAVCVTAAVTPGGKVPEHRDCLGSVLGLGIERSCLGDILPDPQAPGRFFLLVQENKAAFLCRELVSVGRFSARAEEVQALPEQVVRGPERVLREATVPSLRADSVLAAMMHGSRAQAAELIAAGRVEVNHVPLKAAHEPAYEQDIFTVRGAGRYKLAAIGGKSRKDRIFITFFQY